MNLGEVLVHKGHCCVKHGCKYGNSNCPVVRGKVKQDHPCESCDWDERYLQNMNPVCPHCGRAYNEQSTEVVTTNYSKSPALEIWRNHAPLSLEEAQEIAGDFYKLLAQVGPNHFAFVAKE